MFKGNIPLKIEKLGSHDRYGQASVSAVSNSRCSIVKLSTDRSRTSVRTDTSASGGNAHEIAADARLLVNFNADIAIGDRLTVAGVTLKLDSKLLRNDVHGKSNHWQCDCSIWA
ncbi:MAG: hypothetical protein ACXWXL_03315 [Candidatus Binatia bacterium]